MASEIPEWLKIALGVGTGVGGAAIGHAVAQNSAANAVPPELSQLSKIAVDRAAYQNPLFQATNQGIYGMLPDFAKQGTSLSGSLSNQAPAPSSASSGGGGMNPLLAAGLGAGGMGLLDALLKSQGGSNIPFDAILKGLKKLFGGGGRDTVQGNQPQPGGAAMNPTQGYPDMSFTGWDSSVSDPYGNPYLPSDPGFYTGMNFPNDPSGGTGVGPGMQEFYGGGGQMTDPWNPGGRP